MTLGRTERRTDTRIKREDQGGGRESRERREEKFEGKRETRRERKGATKEREKPRHKGFLQEERKEIHKLLHIEMGIKGGNINMLHLFFPWQTMEKKSDLILLILLILF